MAALLLLGLAGSLAAPSIRAQSCGELLPEARPAPFERGDRAELFEAARASLSKGDMRGAYSLASRILRDTASPADARLATRAEALSALSQALQGNLATAQPIVERVRRGLPGLESRERAEVLHWLAIIELRAGNPQAAEGLLNQAADGSPAADFRLGLLLTRVRGPFPLAVRQQAARDALGLLDGLSRPWHRDVELLAANLLVESAEILSPDERAGLFARANKARESALTDSATSSALFVLASLHHHMGQSGRALEVLDDLLSLALRKGFQIDPRWPWLRAEILVSRNELSEAAQAYDLAIQEATRQRQSLDFALMAAGLSFQQRFGPLFQAYFRLLLSEAPLDGVRSETRLQRVVEVAELSRLADLTALMRDPCLISDRRASRSLPASADAVLYPILLEDRVELLVLHKEGLFRAGYAVPRGEIQARAGRLLGQLQMFSTRLYRPTAQALHAALIEPVLPELRRRKVRHLVVAPDGVLRTIPFAALHDGKRFLIEEFSLSLVPGLDMTQVQPLDRSNIKSLAVGLSEARQGFEELPAVVAEVGSVASALQCTPVLNQSFTTGRLRQDLSESRASVVHVASHATFSPDPRSTFLLTYDGKLGMEDIRDALLASARQRRPLELLVLSACQTAAGDERAALGLAGMALRTGARSAVASLWQVSDDSTSILVQKFYAALIGEGKSRGEALRLAQLEVLRKDDFSHPAFWAPFILIGSWL